jgi:hypothetical protein
MEASSHPSEEIRNRLFRLQWLLSSVEGRSGEKIQKAYTAALGYCDFRIADADQEEKSLPLWEKIREHLKALDLKSDHRPAWHMEAECDELRRIYDPVQKEKDIPSAVMGRLFWMEDCRGMMGCILEKLSQMKDRKDAMSYVIEKLVWKHSHLDPFPITYPGLDEAKTKIIELVIDDYSGGDYARMPLKKSEALAIKTRLEAIHEKRASSIRGGRLCKMSLKDSILASTALRIAAGEEVVAAAFREGINMTDCSDGYMGDKDATADYLYDDISASRGALDVLRKATQSMENHLRQLSGQYNSRASSYSDENLSVVIKAARKEAAGSSIVIEKIFEIQAEDDKGKSIYDVRIKSDDASWAGKPYLDFRYYFQMVELSRLMRKLTVDKVTGAPDDSPLKAQSAALPEMDDDD